MFITSTNRYPTQGLKKPFNPRKTLIDSRGEKSDEDANENQNSKDKKQYEDDIFAHAENKVSTIKDSIGKQEPPYSDHLTNTAFNTGFQKTKEMTQHKPELSSSQKAELINNYTKFSRTQLTAEHQTSSASGLKQDI